MCHLIFGDTKGILTMFVRKKKYPSGNIGVIVVEKIGGKMKELATIGVAYSEDEVENLVNEAKEWISKEKSRRHPQLDLYGEEREACDREREEVRRVLSNVSNILLNGCDLILDRTFDRIGFNRIDDDVFRKLVKARLAYPTSKAATVEYLKNHFDEDVDLSKIYRYLDKLSDHQHEIVQDISVRHTAKLFGGNIGVLFYDVTTLYFEADYEDELRKTGFSKEGRHSNPQIILGLLVSLGGYPLAYCIHEGNKYEGHTMLPTINEFVSKYGLENFVVVADSGLMNNANIAELEAHGYKYIIGAKIKNESQEVKNWILEQPKRDCQMVKIYLVLILHFCQILLPLLKALIKTEPSSAKSFSALESPCWMRSIRRKASSLSMIGFFSLFVVSILFTIYLNVLKCCRAKSIPFF